MTKSQSITTANNWAYSIRGDRRSSSVALFCANEVLDAIIGAEGDNDVAYDALASLLREWIRSRKASLEKPIQRLSQALQLETYDVIS